MVARDGVETADASLFRAAETVLAVTYKNVEGCASTVRTRKATAKRVRRRAGFFSLIR
jgi:hypothetical protein